MLIEINLKVIRSLNRLMDSHYPTLLSTSIFFLRVYNPCKCSTLFIVRNLLYFIVLTNTYGKPFREVTKFYMNGYS